MINEIDREREAIRRWA